LMKIENFWMKVFGWNLKIFGEIFEWNFWVKLSTILGVKKSNAQKKQLLTIISNLLTPSTNRTTTIVRWWPNIVWQTKSSSRHPNRFWSYNITVDSFRLYIIVCQNVFNSPESTFAQSPFNWKRAITSTSK